MLVESFTLRIGCSERAKDFFVFDRTLSMPLTSGYLCDWRILVFYARIRKLIVLSWVILLDLIASGGVFCVIWAKRTWVTSVIRPYGKGVTLI